MFGIGFGLIRPTRQRINEMPVFTIRNDVHNTEAMIATGRHNLLLPHQIESIRRRLCSIKGCDCGGQLKESGPQICKITVTKQGKIRLGGQTKPF